MRRNKLTRGQRRAEGQQNSKKHDKYSRNRPNRILKRKKILELVQYQDKKKYMEEISKAIKERQPLKTEGGFENK